MKRFGLAILFWTLASTLLWWGLHEPASWGCIALARLLHRLVGMPAPFLIAEISGLWWLAPPVQLFVGIVLGSGWLTWRRRFALLFYGLTVLTLLTGLVVVLSCSPYIGLPPARSILSVLLTKSLLIVAPIFVGVFLVGVPPKPWLYGAKSRDHDGGQGHSRRPSPPTKGSGIRLWAAFAPALLPAGVAMIIWALAATAPQEVRELRGKLASSLRAENDVRSIGYAAQLGLWEAANRGHDLTLYYLTARLCQRHGDIEAARRVLAPVRAEPFMRPIVAELDALEPTMSKTHGANATSRRSQSEAFILPP